MSGGITIHATRPSAERERVWPQERAESLRPVNGLSVLSIENLRVCRAERTLLRDVSFSLEAPGLLFLVGSGGEGKSSLLAGLAGGYPDEVSLAGETTLNGKPLADPQHRRIWVPQHTQVHGERPIGQQMADRFGQSPDAAREWLPRYGLADMVQALDKPAAAYPRSLRRVLGVLAALQQPGDVYLIDEPTADMDDAHIELVRARLRELGETSLAVITTHNRQDCLALGGTTALIAGGTVQEAAPSGELFAQPRSAAARTYVETGNCRLSPPAIDKPAVSHGIWWPIPGLMAGMSRPGLAADIGIQLQTLLEQGVRCLVCLEERCYYPVAPIREAGLSFQHFPVQDMAPPSFSQAVDLCRLAEPLIRANEGVALHCRGGLGRTGTGLAAILIWFGEDPEAAIAKVRLAQPLAIQSTSQTRFLHDFADRIRGWNCPPPME